MIIEFIILKKCSYYATIKSSRLIIVKKYKEVAIEDIHGRRSGFGMGSHMGNEIKMNVSQQRNILIFSQEQIWVHNIHEKDLMKGYRNLLKMLQSVLLQEIKRI